MDKCDMCHEKVGDLEWSDHLKICKGKVEGKKARKIKELKAKARAYFQEIKRIESVPPQTDYDIATNAYRFRAEEIEDALGGYAAHDAGKVLGRIKELRQEVNALQRDYPALNIETGEMTYRGNVYVEKVSTGVWRSWEDARAAAGMVRRGEGDLIGRIKALVADQDDARLGRLVRAMTPGYVFRVLNSSYYVTRGTGHFEECITPEQALEAAGVRDPRETA